MGLIESVRATIDDRALRKQLKAGYHFEMTKVGDLSFRNRSVAEIVGTDPSLKSENTLPSVYNLLKASGTFNIPLQDFVIQIDGVDTIVTVVNASENGTGDMTSAVWTRDLSRIAASLMNMYQLDKTEYAEEGSQAKKVLSSCLTIMSTPAQLERMDKTIRGETDRDDHDTWPHIRLSLNNLNGEKPEGWRHNQDALQMAAVTAFEALENGTLSVDDLTPAHKKFLASTLPFLISVGYPYCEDVGSWEEVRAIRSSTNAYNWALAEKVLKFSTMNGYDFLNNGFDEYKDIMPDEYKDKNLAEAGTKFCDETLDVIEAQIGDEAVIGRSIDDPSYNTANAALIYLLQLGIPKVLAERKNVLPVYKRELEQKYEDILLESILSLQMQNGSIGGMARYPKDSYYADAKHPYVSNRVQRPLMAHYSNPKNWGDRSGRQDAKKRTDLEGKLYQEALWLHPPAQLAVWANRKYNESGSNSEKYQDIRTKMLLGVLSGITGVGEKSLRHADGKTEIVKIPAFRVPESIMHIKEKALPNPNTPLFWGSIELQLALAQIIHSN